jgi:transcriptional regulator with XRE-family HTH domain
MSAVPRASQILLVGQRIRQLRKSRHLTQADLASRIGITQSDLSRMESGEYKVGLDTLFKILHVFELSMSRFFEEAPETHEPVEVSEELPEKEQLLADFAELSDDSRREVREFIAFKRQQAERLETRKPKWPTQAREEARSEPSEEAQTGTPETLESRGNQDGEAS